MKMSSVQVTSSETNELKRQVDHLQDQVSWGDMNSRNKYLGFTHFDGVPARGHESKF